MQPDRSLRSKASSLLRNQITWGVSSLVFAMVVALVIAGIYVNPPLQRIVSFFTDDAASLRSGLQVRMAGVPIGTVKDLSLEPHQVRVRLTLDRHAFVGDQSQVDVRMLTIVGGYYVNIDSIGDIPIGGKPIPRERVTMPYSLIETLSDTTKITQHVKSKPINESLNEIQQALTGENVESVSAVIDAGNSLVSAMEKQRGQVTEILDVTNQYVRTFTGYRDKLEVMIRKMSIILQQFSLYSRGFGDALYGLGEVLMSLRSVGEFYTDHEAEFIEKVRNYMEKTRLLVARNGLAVRGVKRAQNLLNRIFDAQNAPPGLLATDLCIPLPGSPC